MTRRKTMKLKLIEGDFEGTKFIMRKVGGMECSGVYNSDGLRSLARLIKGNDPVTLNLTKDSQLHIPIEMNEPLYKEMFMIADKLDEGKS